jgi:hypothetical protein
MKNKIALLVLMVMIVSQSAYAAGCSKDGYCPIKGKLMRGVKGIVTSPIEMCNEYKNARAADYNVAESTASGIFVGAFMAGKRIVNGTYDVITFPINWPKEHGLLFSDSYPTAWDEHKALKQSSVK